MAYFTTQNSLLAWSLINAMPEAYVKTWNVYDREQLDKLPMKDGKPLTAKQARASSIPGKLIYYFEGSKELSALCKVYDDARRDKKPIEVSDGVTREDVLKMAYNTATLYKIFLQSWKDASAFFMESDGQPISSIDDQHKGAPIAGTITLPAFRMVNIDASTETKRSAGF